MAKIRDPAREKAYLLWKEAGGKKAPKGVLTDIAEKLNKNVSLIRKWKNIDEWEQTITNKNNSNVTDKNGNITSKKKLIQKAKAIVINGGTLEEASTETNININTLKTYSAKEKWIDQQEKFMQKVYSDLQEKHGNEYIKHREDSLEMLKQLRSYSYAKLSKEQLDKDNVSIINSVVNIVLKTIKGESELLGIPEMKMYIRQEKEDKEEQEPVTIIDDIGGNNEY